MAPARNVDQWLSGVGQFRDGDPSSESDQSSDYENICPSLRRPLYPREVIPTPEDREFDGDEMARERQQLQMERLLRCEKACYEELTRVGAQPVTTVEALEASGFESAPTYEATLPWHGSADVSDDLEYTTVLQKQVARWWHFQKSQWHYRNIVDDEEGLTAFRESRKRIDAIIRDDVDTSDPSYDAAMRVMWTSVNDFPFIAEADALVGRQHTVKKDIASYNFKHLPDLKQNPQEQSRWANWLEYLSFELQCLKALDRECHEIRNRFNVFTVTLGHERHKLFHMPAAQSLEALDIMNEVAHSIHESIAEFRQKHAELYDIRLRVTWIVREAHRMDAGLTEKESEVLKRKRTDEDVEESESRKPARMNIGEKTEGRTSKRIRMSADDELSVDSEVRAAPQSRQQTQGIVPPRRSSRISAQKHCAQAQMIIEPKTASKLHSRPTTPPRTHHVSDDVGEEQRRARVAKSAVPGRRRRKGPDNN